jgi:hypothetical protein
MNFSADELKKLAVPLAILIACWAAGAAMIYWAQGKQRDASLFRDFRLLRMVGRWRPDVMAAIDGIGGPK